MLSSSLQSSALPPVPTKATTDTTTKATETIHTTTGTVNKSTDTFNDASTPERFQPVSPHLSSSFRHAEADSDVKEVDFMSQDSLMNIVQKIMYLCEDQDDGKILDIPTSQWLPDLVVSVGPKNWPNIVKLLPEHIQTLADTISQPDYLLHNSILEHSNHDLNTRDFAGDFGHEPRRDSSAIFLAGQSTPSNITKHNYSNRNSPLMDAELMSFSPPKNLHASPNHTVSTATTSIHNTMNPFSPAGLDKFSGPVHMSKSAITSTPVVSKVDLFSLKPLAFERAPVLSFQQSASLLSSTPVSSAVKASMSSSSKHSFSQDPPKWELPSNPSSYIGNRASSATKVLSRRIPTSTNIAMTPNRSCVSLSAIDQTEPDQQQKSQSDWMVGHESPDTYADIFKESDSVSFEDDNSGEIDILGITGLSQICDESGAPGGLVGSVTGSIGEPDTSFASIESPTNSSAFRRLQRNFDSTCNDLRKQEEHNRDLQSDLNAAKQSLQSQNCELITNKNEIERLHEELIKARLKIDELSALEVKYNDVLTKFEKEKARSEEMSDSFYQKLMDKQEKFNDLQNNFKNQASVNFKLQEKTKALESQLTILSAETTAFQQEYGVYHNKYHEEYDLRVRLEEEVSNLTMELQKSKSRFKDSHDSNTSRNTTTLATELLFQSKYVSQQVASTQTLPTAEDETLCMLQEHLRTLADEMVTIESQKVSFRLEMDQVRESARETRRVLHQCTNVDAEMERRMQSLCEDLACVKEATKVVKQNLEKETKFQQHIYKKVVERPASVGLKVPVKNYRDAGVQAGATTKNAASECSQAVVPKELLLPSAPISHSDLPMILHSPVQHAALPATFTINRNTILFVVFIIMVWSTAANSKEILHSLFVMLESLLVDPYEIKSTIF
ncbi:hypothetical protein RTP6_001749 [Batrachochytrium dendrobatidis]